MDVGNDSEPVSGKGGGQMDDIGDVGEVRTWFGRKLNGIEQETSDGGHLSVRRRITRDDVLQYLASSSGVASNLGSMLDAIRDGTSKGGGGEPSGEAQLRASQRMLADCQVIRCVDGLEKYASIRYVACTDLRRFAGHANAGDGQAAILVLRAYQEWATQSTERGLFAVYGMMRDRCPHMGWSDSEKGVAPTVEEFREGTVRAAKLARSHALRVLADAEIALGGWIEIWNRKGARK